MPAYGSSSNNKKRPAPSAAVVPDPYQQGGSATKKRKIDANAQKYYAVRVGIKPGVYLTWPECQAQTAGFRGAVYKSFTSRDDADAFVAGKNPKPADAKPEPEKFYAVATGEHAGIYTDWETASVALRGVKGPKYKRFPTYAEAVAFLRQWGNEHAINWLEAEGEKEHVAPTVLTRTAVPAPAVPKSATSVPVPSRLAAGVTTVAAAAAAKAAKQPIQTEEEKATAGFLNIWTDGSSLANGKAGAVAGVGVFFGKKDPRNISERLEGDVQTNQRAELTAILRALQIAPLEQDVMIRTDSQYSINCVTIWSPQWEKKGWKTATGEDVKNRDIVEAIRARLKQREQKKTQTVFKWLKGHSVDEGNNAADSLAVSGARAAKAARGSKRV